MTDGLAGSARPTRAGPRSTAEAAAFAARSARRTGAARSRLPAELVSPVGAAPTGFRPILVSVVSPISGQLGRYDAKSISGRLDATAAGTLTAAQLGAMPAAADVELWYAGDIGGTLPGSLKSGDVLVALAGPLKPSGRVICVAAGPKLKKKTIVTAVSCVNGQISVTTEDLWVFDA